jgi:hypothetical protein
MSGGVIDTQDKKGEHQVVIFTFAGVLKPDECQEWNAQIVKLKSRFGTRIMGVTLRGEKTPSKWLPGNQKRSKKRS